MALPTSPISGINQNLFPFKVDSQQFFEEWIQITPLASLMGSQLNRPIYRHKLRDGEGLQFRVARLNALDYKNPVTGLDQRRGSEQEPVVSEARFDIVFKSFLVKLVGKDIVQLGTPIRLPEHVRSQLTQVCARNLNYDLFNAMTTDLFVPSAASSSPSFDRIAVAGPVNGKTATTRDEYNALQTVSHAFNAFGNATAAESGLSGDHLLALKNMALRGGADVNAEARIQPAFMETRGGWPINDYIYLMDPDSFLSLRKDPSFLAETTARGVVVSSDQPQAIHGADYVGKYQGIHLYVVQDLADYRFKSQDGQKTAAWNIFMGAGALTVGWHEMPFIVYEEDNIERHQLFASHEQRGLGCLRFKGKGTTPSVLIEQGIIHSFVRIA